LPTGSLRTLHLSMVRSYTCVSYHNANNMEPLNKWCSIVGYSGILCLRIRKWPVNSSWYILILFPYSWYTFLFFFFLRIFIFAIHQLVSFLSESLAGLVKEIERVWLFRTDSWGMQDFWFLSSWFFFADSVTSSGG
jgi:hypothetical protein